MKLLFDAKIEEAVRITVEFPANDMPYALNWLKLTNNAREYSREFLSVENSPGRKVYVTCLKEHAESVRDYLEWLGEVVDESKVYVCRPYPTQRAEDYLWSIIDKDEDAEIVMIKPEDLF